MTYPAWFYLANVGTAKAVLELAACARFTWVTEFPLSLSMSQWLEMITEDQTVEVLTKVYSQRAVGKK